jgi:tetratricopeptide (TPR) repeat protein
VDYLGRTYFDDAVAGIAGFRAGQDQEVQALFGRYKAARLAADPRADVREEEADLRLLLGQANALLLESVQDDEIGAAASTALLDRAIAHYSEALRLRPGDYRAEYNRAITIYNHGVRQLKRIDPETSLFELMEVQDACIALFERALVPLQPERLETLKGLMTVHRALSQLDESERYRVELERVIRMNRGRG